MIYFVQPVDGGPIKIGTSENVPARVKQLEGTYNRPLVVLATMQGGRNEEREMHARFAHLRFGRTEQFQPAPELLDFIGKPLFAAAGDVVEMEVNRPVAVTIKGNPAWKTWLEEAAAHCRLSISALVDVAVAKHAKAEGFPDEAPQR